MAITWRFSGWSLANKLAALIVVVSLIPLGIATALDIRWQRQLLLSSTTELLRDNAGQLAAQLDSFISTYQHVAARFGHVPDIVRLMQLSHDAAQAPAATSAARELLKVLPSNDRQVIAVALLDPHGSVLASSNAQLEGSVLPAYVDPAVARQGAELRYAEVLLGGVPALVISAPIILDGRDAGTSVLWVHATALWDLMKQANGRVGADSRAVLLDRSGIRIGRDVGDRMSFHPAATVDPASLGSMVDDQRFAQRTQELLNAVLEFPDDSVPASVHSPFDGAPNLGVARRLASTRWTIVYLVPRESVLASMSRISRRTALLAGSIMLLAMVAGTGVAASILAPMRSLSTATQKIASGDLSARARIGRADEMGLLGTSFNTMAARIETQARQLQLSHDELEARVKDRTAELAHTTGTLERAVAERVRVQQLLRGIVDSTDDAIISKTLDGTVLTWNPAAERLFGYPAAQAIGGSAMIIVPPERIGEEQTIVQRIARGESVRHLETLRLRADGERLDISATVSPLRDSDGRIVGASQISRDIRERKAAERELRKVYGALQTAYDDLRQSQQVIMQQERLKALGQMASGIAHDINNALSPAALYVQSLLETEKHLTDAARHQLRTIERSIMDVSKTVARMRQFYQPRETVGSASPVDLNALIAHIVALTRARWDDMPKERGVVITVETQLAADLPRVLGAENEIGDALTNLIINGVDAMPDGGMLRIRSFLRRAEHDAVCVEVSDSGVGMDEAVRSQCLEPFFTTKGERGTGLGLAMVYGMAVRHDGNVEVDSAPAKGTTVRLTFPNLSTSLDDKAGPISATTRPLRILVVDDDPLILQTVKRILEQDGHRVHPANGGQSGVDAFMQESSAESAFDIVITDLGMPGMDGRSVAAAIKRRSPSTPIVMLTGWGHRLLEENELPTHVDRVLSKPPRLSELRLALQELGSGVTVT